MCGIAGFINSNNNYSLNDSKKIILKMTNSIWHRGPDSSDHWICENNTIIFGHRRLSIQDLSINGSQPMTSFDEKLIITFNGEIYNHLLLRDKINKFSNKKIIWRGHSDTETLVNGFAVLGLEKFLQEIRGMFAFALWDLKAKILFLVRDSVGEKPLFYGSVGNNFLFSSEIKSFEVFPNFNKKINKNALSQFNSFMYIPEPLTIYNDIYKLPPGSFLKIPINNEKNQINLSNHKIQKWIDFENLFKNNKIDKGLNSHITDIDDKLTQSIQSQLISDVPVGVFLSGGVDSSLITSILKIKLNKSPETFTIGFKDKLFDESNSAKKISEYLGCQHNELIFSEKYACDQIPKILNNNDEPFADSSIIPTTILSSFARKKVKVALSGDGADELFGGYNRYILTKSIWNKYSIVPSPLNKLLLSVLNIIPYKKIDQVNQNLHFFNYSNIEDKANKMIDKLKRSKNIQELYINLLSEWNDQEKLIHDNDNSSQNNLYNEIQKLNFTNIEEMMMFIDFKYYLPDDILCKVDRSSMINSLETRAPFLDLDLIIESLKVPTKYKINKKTNKYILRKLLSKYLPTNLISKPKKGFGIPLNSWLRGHLKEFVLDTLNLTDIKNQGFYNVDILKNILDQHYMHNRNWGHKIWSILVFQCWLKNKKL